MKFSSGTIFIVAVLISSTNSVSKELNGFRDFNFTMTLADAKSTLGNVCKKVYQPVTGGELNGIDCYSGQYFAIDVMFQAPNTIRKITTRFEHSYSNIYSLVKQKHGPPIFVTGGSFDRVTWFSDFFVSLKKANFGKKVLVSYYPKYNYRSKQARLKYERSKAAPKL